MKPFLFQCVPVLVTVCVVTTPVRAAKSGFPEATQLPVQPELPDPLVMMDGKRVTSARQWNDKRRPEMKALFEHYMYGAIPPKPKKIEFNRTLLDQEFLGGEGDL